MNHRDYSYFQSAYIHYTLPSYPQSESTPTAIMPRSCSVCKAVASPELYCSVCHSALYCSRACQSEDWKKKQHKKIYKLVNVGHGDMQVRHDDHISQAIHAKEEFETNQRIIDEDEDAKNFFLLFREGSTFEESLPALLYMQQIADRQPEQNYRLLLHHSLRLLIRSDPNKLSWPTSPLLVMLEYIDPDVLLGDEDDVWQEGENNETLLHLLADLADSFDYSTHDNQVILAKQLIEHGANVNAVSVPKNETPLHAACYSGSVTNLDFLELLLKNGADPNARDRTGNTPLMFTLPLAPGAGKFMLNWPTTDVNIPARSGESFLSRVREVIEHFSNKLTFPNNPESNTNSCSGSGLRSKRCW
jgi:hypothetical protein